MEFNFKAAILERWSDNIRWLYCPLWLKPLACIFSFGRFGRVLFGFSKFLFFFPIAFLIFFGKSKGCSKVFIGGGNILMGIEYGFPLQAFSYALFGRLIGIPVCFLCVGAGPFTAPGVKQLLRATLRLAQRVICRDTKSLNTISTELGENLTVLDVLPDPVLIWPKISVCHEFRFDVLFTFMPLFSPSIFPDGSDIKFNNYIASAVELIVSLINNGKNIGVFVTDPGVDLAISQSIISRVMGETGEKLDLIVPESPNEMAEIVGKARVVMSTRMHGAIMSFSQSIPAFCVAWQPKIEGLYDDLKMNDFLIQLDAIGRFPVNETLQRLSEVCQHRSAVTERIEARRNEINEQYVSFWKNL